MELETIKFIKNNKNTWQEDLKKEPYSLKIIEDENYYLLKYNLLSSDFHSPIVKECRGLIISKEDLEPKALSFFKFHNVQEEEYADKIDWETAEVQQKVDGSKILVWYDNDIWHISTSGTIDAFNAVITNTDITFGKLFEDALKNNGYQNISEFFSELNYFKNFCFSFELVSPKSLIVVNYKQTDIYFIGLRNTKTFLEYKTDNDTLQALAMQDNDFFSLKLFNIKRPNKYPLHSLKECLEATSVMNIDEEGYVVVDENWKRVKIKSPLYVTAHYMKNNGMQNEERFLQVIENNNQDDFLALCPEWKEDIEKVIEKKGKLFLYMEKSLMEIINSKNLITQKDFALWIMENYKELQSFLFYTKRKYFKNEKWESFELENMILDYWNTIPIGKKLEYINLKTI